MHILDPLDVSLRINNLSKLEDNWYEGHGKALNKKGLERFGNLFNSYFENKLPLPAIKDYYTNPLKTITRYIDLLLVDSNGNVDVIEIKKPFDNCIISKSRYRDNYTPMKELSGTIMQVEKYIFHLNKWGIEGEKALSKRYKGNLPLWFKIRITNPKGIVILGRNNNLSEEQLFDLEIIKRKYSNLVDIITYDDLIHRLENLLEKYK